MRPGKLSILVLLALAGSAHAATITTAPLFGVVSCLLTNVDSKVRDVTLEVRNQNGTVVASAPDTMLPGAATGIAAPGTGLQYCSFTVKGPAKKFRAVACVNAGDDLACVPGQ